MKSTLRGIIGVIFVLASLLKLATLWGIMHLSWLENATEEPSVYYFAIAILIFVGLHLIFEGFKGYHANNYITKRLKIVVGIIMVVALLLKLAVMLGILHLSWLENEPSDSLELYLAIFILLYLGCWLIIDGFRSDPGQWLQRPLPLNEDGKRISCSASFGGDEYIYKGETFHGARLEATFGGIRLDLRNAVINEEGYISCEVQNSKGDSWNCEFSAYKLKKGKEENGDIIDSDDSSDDDVDIDEMDDDTVEEMLKLGIKEADNNMPEDLGDGLTMKSIRLKDMSRFSYFAPTTVIMKSHTRRYCFIIA